MSETTSVPRMKQRYRDEILPALREEFARTGEPLYYPKDRHLKAPGHAIVARAIKAGALVETSEVATIARARGPQRAGAAAQVSADGRCRACGHSADGWNLSESAMREDRWLRGGE